MNNGFQIVGVGDVPCFVFQESIENKYAETENLNACRICLETDGKLFSIGKCNLGVAFEDLTGVLLHSERQLPQHLCGECARRLLGCAKFRHKALTAHSLMTDILKDNKMLTTQLVNAIRRGKNEFSANLITLHQPPDKHDQVLNYDEIDNLNEGLIETEDIIQAKVGLIEEGLRKGSDKENIKIETDLVADGDKSEIIEVKEASEMNDQTYNLITDNQCKVSKDGPETELIYVNEIGTERNSERSENILSKDTCKIRKKKSANLVSYKCPKKSLDTNLFVVKELSMDEQMAEIEARRNSDEYRRSAFGCKECYKVFLNTDLLKRHAWKHTAAAGDARCSICQCRFQSGRLVRAHAATHSRRYTCTQCAYVTSAKCNAVLHQRSHEGHTYKCSTCFEEFVHHSTYMGHLRLKHPTDIACQLCGYSFISEKGVEQHKRLKHRGESWKVPPDGPYCDLCGIKFANAQALESHKAVSNRHTETKRKRNEPVREDGVKDGAMPCEQCGEEIHSWRAYNQHFKASHPDKNRTLYPPRKTAMCDQCGVIFPDHTHLTIHRRSHTGEKPYKCIDCGKCYQYKQVYEAHAQTHKLASERTVYACDVCGKRFISNSNRLRHQKFVHTSLRPVACDICGKTFKSKPEKKFHVAHVHHNKPWPVKNKDKNPATVT